MTNQAHYAPTSPAGLNFKGAHVQEQTGAAASAAPPIGRRSPGQEASFESRSKELPVVFPPPPFSMRSGLGNHGFALRFRNAVPLPAVPAVSHTITGAQLSARRKKAKNKHKSKASASAAAAELGCDEDDGPQRIQLHVADIPRVRLVLCHDADVKDGQLPQLHVEVDPCLNMSVAVSEFQKISRSSKLAPAKPHSGHQWYVCVKI